MSELQLKIVSVSGPDAFEFMQSQLSNDLQELSGTLHTSEAHCAAWACDPSDDSMLSAWCNPKGRVIWFGTVQTTASGYALSVAADLVEEFVRRLTIFRFRSEVEFAIEADRWVSAEHLIRQGYPFIGRAQSELFTPHMLNLDLLQAVSVDKGCYPGQEIVARTHYRGATRRRLLRFECSKSVVPGDKVLANNRAVGEVLNAAGKDLLAVVPFAKADELLCVNDAALQFVPLPYF